MVALFQQFWTSYFVDFWKLFVLKLFFMKLWWQEIFGIKCTCKIKIDINFQKQDMYKICAYMQNAREVKA